MERKQALPYITWGLIWDSKSNDDRGIPVHY